MSDPNTCHRCGASITGFERLYLDGFTYHRGCAPMATVPDDGGPVRETAGLLSISLRDYFAAAAIETMKIKRRYRVVEGDTGTLEAVWTEMSPDEVAARAYTIADAMLEARKQKP